MPPGISYSTNYLEQGKQLWYLFKSELYDMICVAEKHEPRGWVNELITGDIRNLITGIVSALTAKYNVQIAISLPVTALIIKTGVLKYCLTQPDMAGKRVEDVTQEKMETESRDRLA